MYFPFIFKDLLESGTKIVKGALGMISNQEGWEKQVEEAKTLEEMVGLDLHLSESFFITVN